LYVARYSFTLLSELEQRRGNARAQGSKRQLEDANISRIDHYV